MSKEEKPLPSYEHRDNVRNSGFLARKLEKAEWSHEIARNPEYQRLFEPIGGKWIEYHDNQESVLIEKDNLKLALAFRTIPFSTLNQGQRFQLAQRYDFFHEMSKSKTETSTNQLIELTKFSICRRDVRGQEVCCDPKAEAPRRTRIIVLPHQFGDFGRSFVYSQPASQENMIFLEGNPEVPATIIALMHELGHLVIDQSQLPATRNQFRQARRAMYDEKVLNEEQATLILEDERKAWAFALKRLRHFFPVLADSAIVKALIHRYALKKYSKRLAQLMREETA